MEYFRPSKDEHESISKYLETEFFVYLDSLGDKKFQDGDEKETLKRFLKIVAGSFKKSQDAISTAFGKGDHSLISRYTDRLNEFLADFCEGRIFCERRSKNVPPGGRFKIVPL